MNNTIKYYTSLPNYAMEWLYGPHSSLTLREMKVMMMVFRYTYGFRRSHAMLSNRFVGKGTGIDHSDVSRVFTALVDKGLIRVSTSKRIRIVWLIPKAYRGPRPDASQTRSFAPDSLSDEQARLEGYASQQDWYSGLPENERRAFDEEQDALFRAELDGEDLLTQEEDWGME